MSNRPSIRPYADVNIFGIDALVRGVKGHTAVYNVTINDDDDVVDQTVYVRFMRIANYTICIISDDRKNLYNAKIGITVLHPHDADNLLIGMKNAFTKALVAYPKFQRYMLWRWYFEREEVIAKGIIDKIVHDLNENVVYHMQKKSCCESECSCNQ